MSDVPYCIGTSFADPQTRASEEEKLFAHYLSCLSDDGVRDYDADRAWQDYRLAAFSGFTMKGDRGDAGGAHRARRRNVCGDSRALRLSGAASR